MTTEVANLIFNGNTLAYLGIAIAAIAGIGSSATTPLVASSAS